MKKIFTYALLALFSITVMGVAPARGLAVYAQFEIAQKDRKEKKDPPGPPVVRDKGKKGEGKKPEPKKGKKQDEF
ncbi:MAG TPA: hypothetical protein VE262_03245 [Blastocatellia bacterium]|nr:hypothetical protein [Blastocatellia bacterium]